MKEKRTVFAATMPAICACGLAVFAVGCSPEWISGGAPETPTGAFVDDPVAVPAPAPEAIPEQKQETTDTLAPVQQTPGQQESGEAEIQLFSPDGGEVKVEAEEPAPVPAPAKEETPAPAPVVNEIVYTVCKGDTLSHIAESYDADWKVIAEYNKLDPKATLRVNQQIRIPETALRRRNIRDLKDVKNVEEKLAPVPAPEKKKVEPAKPGPAAQKQEGQRTHKIVKGDMFSKLALTYKVPAAAIAKANGLTLTSTLQIGKTLVIPPADPTFMQKKAQAKTTVKKPAAEKKTVEKPQPEKKETPAPAPAVNRDDPPGLNVEEPAAPAPAKENDAPAPALPDDDTPVAHGESVDVTTPSNANSTIESYRTTAYKGATLRILAKDMGADLEKVLKLNPGIGADEVFSSPQQIQMPLE